MSLLFFAIFCVTEILFFEEVILSTLSYSPGAAFEVDLKVAGVSSWQWRGLRGTPREEAVLSGFLHFM